MAIEYENYLGVALRAPDGAGWLALYQRSGTGWTGVITNYNRDDLFALAMYNGQAPALLNPKQTTSVQVSGKYAISGTNPDGSTYSGQVQIISSSGIIDIIRNPGTEEMTGSGTVIVVNGTLAMNVAPTPDIRDRSMIGIVGVFIPQADGFLGVWNRPGSNRLGAERWTRK